MQFAELFCGNPDTFSMFERLEEFADETKTDSLRHSVTTMTFEQVWYRFEVQTKDGSELKLRIQDLPPARLNDALDLLENVFMRDEPIHRAVGIVNNSEAIATHRNFLEHRMSGSLYRMVICCSDNTPEVTKLIGLSMIGLNTNFLNVDKSSPILHTVKNKEVPQENKKLYEIFYELKTSYSPVKELNVKIYYEDKGLVVDPDYRGLGIPQNLLKVRRLMCKAHGVPMTGAWVTAFGTQAAAIRDGWETVKEIEYDYLAKKYGVTFTDAPRTVKYMIARVKYQHSRL